MEERLGGGHLKFPMEKAKVPAGFFWVSSIAMERL